MPFELGGALDKGRTLHTTITLEGIEGGLPLDYFPNKAEDAQEALLALNTLGGTKDERRAGMEAVLFSLVASWDASVQGVPVPLTSEGFAAFGINTAFVAQLIAAVIGEAYAGEASGIRLQKRLRNS